MYIACLETSTEPEKNPLQTTARHGFQLSFGEGLNPPYYLGQNPKLKPNPLT